MTRTSPPPRRWDLFCRVVDNLGDAAVTWRIARQLAGEHGVAPRLWIDAPEALARLVPGAAPGLEVDGVRIERWDPDAPGLARPAPAEVADVVVAAFGCDPPEGYRAAMRTRRPVWLNLEYLSAERWIDDHHGLPSPKPDGLVEHFFFPGFGEATGGLPREADLFARRAAFLADPAARAAFLASIGVEAVPGERLASVFCYPGSPVGALADALAARGWRL
ncbi:MAG TPA: elongation factor P maturation arginine rhamnosyltransferase EarP, partial [Burkholderiaceae bacterium]|nr:elongation factor P maturation arginine rhamnosyltransferase EarP [Burkholderiaceae bacterium]